MKNDLVEMGVDVMNALAALKMKRARLRSSRDGVEIIQPGRPRLLLTYQAARDYTAEVEESEA